MTAAILSDGRPISEEDFLAMGETPDRLELFDGSLFMTPNPTTTHQHLLGELYAELRLPARAAGLHVLLAPNVRLQPNRIPIPDLVITTDMGRKLVLEARTVLLVCEVTSPSNATTDKVFKMHYYAAAGIPWYLLIDQKTTAMHLYRLANGTYVEHSTARKGEVLRLSEPVVAVLDPKELALPD
ncbi:Uma2 family endonuclease [Actinoplanes sp. NPDC026619]|uniref:Uma2 family endonuclease n=1 Tax=Actinoplanes sp. NPDC026619 TaxID=3155798 RepID=UPI0033D73C7C